MKLRIVGIIAIMVTVFCLFSIRPEASSLSKDIYVPVNVDLKEIFNNAIGEDDIIYDYWSDPVVANDQDFNQTIEIKKVIMGKNEAALSENNDSSVVELPLSPDLSITISDTGDTDKVYVKIPEMMVTATLLDPIRVEPLVDENQTVNLFGEQWHTLSVKENEPKKDGTKSILISMNPIGDTELRPETMRLTVNGISFDGSTHIRGGESFHDYIATYFVFTDIPADLEIDWDTASLEILSLMYVKDSYVLEVYY